MNILKPLILGLFFTNIAFASDLTFQNFKKSTNKNYFLTNVLKNNSLFNSRSCIVLKHKELKELSDSTSNIV